MCSSRTPVIPIATVVIKSPTSPTHVQAKRDDKNGARGRARVGEGEGSVRRSTRERVREGTLEDSETESARGTMRKSARGRTQE